VGDYVVTHPLDKKEYKKFADAAYAWAWHKRWRVSISSIPKTPTTRAVKLTLVSKTLVRDYA